MPCISHLINVQYGLCCGAVRPRVRRFWDMLSGKMGYGGRHLCYISRFKTSACSLSSACVRLGKWGERVQKENETIRYELVWGSVYVGNMRWILDSAETCRGILLSCDHVRNSAYIRV
jgi:hypothetical protein